MARETGRNGRLHRYGVEASATRAQQKAEKGPGQPAVTRRGTRRAPEFPQLTGKPLGGFAQASLLQHGPQSRLAEALASQTRGSLSPRLFQEAATAFQLGHQAGLKRLLAKNRLKWFISTISGFEKREIPLEGFSAGGGVFPSRPLIKIPVT